MASNPDVSRPVAVYASQVLPLTVPTCRFTIAEKDERNAFYKKQKDVKTITQGMELLRTKVQASIPIERVMPYTQEKTYLEMLPKNRAKGLVSAQQGIPKPRNMDMVALGVLAACVSGLPFEAGPGVCDDWTLPAFTAKSLDTTFVVGAGAAGSIERIVEKAPKDPMCGIIGVERVAREYFAALVPPTPVEVTRSLTSCRIATLDFASTIPPKKMGFVPEWGNASEYIKRNSHASNGLPFGGKPNLVVLPQILALAEDLYARFETAIRGLPMEAAFQVVDEMLREMMIREPELNTCIGKTKADYYGRQKFMTGMLRHYVNVPAQFGDIMKISTQALEEYHLALPDGTFSGSAMGTVLQHGGADRFVSEMDAEYAQFVETLVYRHVGDDSWVTAKICYAQDAGRDGVGMVMCDADAVAFDLSQPSEVTAVIKHQVAQRLYRIDRVSAAVWYSFMRHRSVIVASGVRVLMTDCGPSGTMGQSKLINDILMDVYLERVKQRIKAALVDFDTVDRTDAAVEGLFQREFALVGRELGITMKVANFSFQRDVGTVREALVALPFKFVGYVFYTQEERVQVYAALARVLAQLAYPSEKWLEKDDFQRTTAMRLGSIVAGLGSPPECLKSFHSRLVASVRTLVVAQLDKLGESLGTLDSFWRDKLETMVGQSGPAYASLRGILRLLDAGPSLVWDEEMVPIPDRSPSPPLVPQGARAVVRLPRPAPLALARDPVTAENAGRPPPTAKKPVARKAVPKPRPAEGEPSRLETARGRRKAHPREAAEFLAYRESREVEEEPGGDLAAPARKGGRGGRSRR